MFRIKLNIFVVLFVAVAITLNLVHHVQGENVNNELPASVVGQDEIGMNRENQPRDFYDDDQPTSGEQFVAVHVNKMGAIEQLNPSLVGLSNMARKFLPDNYKFLHVVSATREVVAGVRFNILAAVEDDIGEEILCELTIMEKPWLITKFGDKQRSLQYTNCSAANTSNDLTETKANHDDDDGDFNFNPLFINHHNSITADMLKSIEAQVIKPKVPSKPIENKIQMKTAPANEIDDDFLKQIEASIITPKMTNKYFVTADKGKKNPYAYVKQNVIGLDEQHFSMAKTTASPDSITNSVVKALDELFMYNHNHDIKHIKNGVDISPNEKDVVYSISPTENDMSDELYIHTMIERTTEPMGGGRTEVTPLMSGVAQETAENVDQETTKDVDQETTKDVVQEIAHDVVQETAQDVDQETTKNVDQEIVQTEDKNLQIMSSEFDGKDEENHQNVDTITPPIVDTNPDTVIETVIEENEPILPHQNDTKIVNTETDIEHQTVGKNSNVIAPSKDINELLKLLSELPENLTKPFYDIIFLEIDFIAPNPVVVEQQEKQHNEDQPGEKPTTRSYPEKNHQTITVNEKGIFQLPELPERPERPTIAENRKLSRKISSDSSESDSHSKTSEESKSSNESHKHQHHKSSDSSSSEEHNRHHHKHVKRDSSSDSHSKENHKKHSDSSSSESSNSDEHHRLKSKRRSKRDTALEQYILIVAINPQNNMDNLQRILQIAHYNIDETKQYFLKFKLNNCTNNMPVDINECIANFTPVARRICEIQVKSNNQLDVKKIECKDENSIERVKRQLVGAPLTVENSDDQIVQLVKESLATLSAQNNGTSHELIHIVNATKQIVAGVRYRINAELKFANNETDICLIDIWDRPWIKVNGRETTIKCSENKLYKLRKRRSVNSETKKHTNLANLYRKFKLRHHRNYDTLAEDKKRFEIFRKNVHLIEQLNELEQGTAKYGITQFADLTPEEFRTRTGLLPRTDENNEIKNPLAQIPDIKELPQTFDWREKGAVTEVKNQGNCGSCWAFSVTGNIEGLYAIKYGTLLEFSEQELVDCDTVDSGCNGGLPDNAYKAIEEIGGLELESEYPYDAKQEKCKFNRTMSRVRVTGAVDLPKNETAMALYLMENGPISIGINANAMQFYRGGISHPWRLLCRKSTLDHGVLIVGFGVAEYPLFNKTLPYWIVKNSWGPKWGEQGYYRVFRGDNTCGVSSMASSAVLG